MHQIKAFLYFLKMIYQQRYVIRKLVIRDFQKKYLGSYLGLPWAFLQPAAYILSLWFVFSIGLRGSGDINGAPYLIWLMTGIIPWFFISESISTSSNSLLSMAFLIKQMDFRVGIIPVISIVSATIIHLFLILIIIIFSISYGYYPNIYWLQLPYYLFGSLILLTGIAWLTSSILVFVRDVEKTISIILTLLFWTTPIFWPHSSVSGRLRTVVDLNPFFYITNGYREAIISNKWFFENINLTIYFWIISFIFLIGGALVFQKLKPHFADVL